MNNHQRSFALNLLAYAVQRGIDVQQLCCLAGIDLNELKRSDKYAFTEQQWEDLWNGAITLSHDALFGLHFGESLQLAALGIVGEIIKTSSTVGEALKQAAALSYLVTDLFHIGITENDKSFTIQFHTSATTEAKAGVAFKQMMDFFTVFMIHELDGLLLVKIDPLQASLPYNNSNQQEYERVLRCRRLKNAANYLLTFDKKYWSEPIITANYALQGVLLKEVMAVQQEVELQSFSARIYNYLMANSYLGVISLEEMAANFNISARTLQRKLKDEGIQYQQLADKVKKVLAQHYLKQGNYQVKEISNMLGYNELSAFTKAFKRWTGTSPSFYQSLPN